MMGLHWITPDEPADSFPPVRMALRDPDGLLAVGGDLSPDRLINAYSRGIFPWYNVGQPILWWSPDPRAVLFPRELHVSRSLRRSLKRSRFTFTVNEDFEGVMRACAVTPRRDPAGTWITAEMISAYSTLHGTGHAQSVETWLEGELVGGIYGITLGKVFFGESMFSRVTDASKAALVLLVREMLARDYRLLDCQVASSHLRTLGSRDLPRPEFLELLEEHVDSRHGDRWKPGVRTDDLHLFDPGR